MITVPVRSHATELSRILHTDCNGCIIQWTHAFVYGHSVFPPFPPHPNSQERHQNSFPPFNNFFASLFLYSRRDMFSHKLSLSVNTMFPCLLSKNFLATFYNEKKCVCVCVCVREREREKERKNERGRKRERRSWPKLWYWVGILDSGQLDIHDMMWTAGCWSFHSVNNHLLLMRLR